MGIEFLSTSKAVELYAKLAIETQGNVQEFGRKWKDIVSERSEQAITQDVNEDDILPKKIIGAIEDTLKTDRVFSQFSPVFNIEPGSLIIDLMKMLMAHGVIQLTLKRKCKHWLYNHVISSLRLFTSCND